MTKFITTTMEELMCELSGEDVNDHGLPPGFRFHPTDEELITFYLASKVFSGTFCGVDIAEVDLNRCEPWDLPDVARMGEREWYFFSVKDRKYPTGLRTNRATGAGYWKATGKDRQVYSGSSGALLGMKKTLVFYKGRAPRGHKTPWVMHEYRLDGDFSYRHTTKEEWVICRIVNKKAVGSEKRGSVLEQQQQEGESRVTCLPQILMESPLTTILGSSSLLSSSSSTTNNQSQQHHSNYMTNAGPLEALASSALIPKQQQHVQQQELRKTESAFLSHLFLPSPHHAAADQLYCRMLHNKLMIQRNDDSYYDIQQRLTAPEPRGVDMTFNTASAAGAGFQILASDSAPDIPLAAAGFHPF